MALFPTTTNLSYETSLPLQSGKRVVIFEDNTNVVQSLASNDIVLNGQIICPFLTVSERDSIMGFYGTNKDVSFTFNNPHDDQTYTLRFVDPAPSPVIDGRYTPTRYLIIFNVIGERQP